MIKGLMGNQGVIVSGGNTSLPYVNQNSANPMQGMIRVWGNDMQVFDGTSWMTMSTSYATVGLDADSQDLLQWARTQRQLELNLTEIRQSVIFNKRLNNNLKLHKQNNNNKIS